MGIQDTVLDSVFFVVILTFTISMVNALGGFNVGEGAYMDVTPYNYSKLNQSLINAGLDTMNADSSGDSTLGSNFLAQFGLIYGLIRDSPIGLGLYVKSVFPSTPNELVILITGILFISYILFFVGLWKGYYW